MVPHPEEELLGSSPFSRTERKIPTGRPALFWSEHRPGAVLIAFVAASLLTILLQVAVSPPLTGPHFEGIDYYGMAAGSHGLARYFYAGRILHPLIVGWVSTLTHAPLALAFYVTNIVALFVFYFFVFLYGFAAEPSPGWQQALLLGCMLATPSVVSPIFAYYWQDLFHAALLAVFFFTLRSNPYLALPVLFALHLTRESTILLTITLVAAALIKGRRRLAVASSLVGVGGVAFSSHFVTGPGNIHRLPMPLFDLLKVGFNFSANILGAVFWTDTIAATNPAFPPVWKMNVPPSWHLHAIREIGFSSFTVMYPLHTLLVMLCAFGILPVLVFRSWRSLGWRQLRGADFSMLTAVLYGALAFVVTPLIGSNTTLERYALYAWPIFLVATWPILNAALAYAPGRAAAVCYLNLLCGWTPMALHAWAVGVPRFFPCSLAIAMAVAAYALTFYLTTDWRFPASAD